MKRVPEGFIYGGATAAYQCEGETLTHGKGKVAWDDFLAEKGRFLGDPASDFYNRYGEDLELCERFGINGIRVSIAWSRIFPEGAGAVNPEGVEFYHNVFAECRRRGVEPFVTLHHFDTPAALYDDGDFLNRATVDAFVEYARFCFAEYADDVTYWFTFNEIWAVATNQYIEGVWPRGHQARLDLAFQCEHNMMVAHARAVNLYKEMGYGGKIGIVHSLEYKYPVDPDSFADIAAAKNEDVLQNQFLLDATFDGAYSAESLSVAERLCAVSGGSLVIEPGDMDELARAAERNDYLGMNYYQSRWIRAYDGPDVLHFNGTGEKGTSRFCLAGVGERVEPDDVPRTDWDWLIYPKGMYDLIMRITMQWPNYKAIYITENGMGYKDELRDGVVMDGPRIDYIREHLDWNLRAQEAGANVLGYFVWSLMDMFSWNNGYNKRYGLFYVDFETGERIPKASAYWFAGISARGQLDV